MLLLKPDDINILLEGESLGKRIKIEKKIADLKLQFSTGMVSV